MKTFKTQTVHFVFSLRIFFSAHAILKSVNYSAKHVCKPLFGSSATIFRLTCSELSLSINVKKLKRSPGNCRTKYKLADGVTALAQLRVLYSGRARSFNRWQPILHPTCITINVDCKHSTNQSFQSESMCNHKRYQCLILCTNGLFVEITALLTIARTTYVK